MKYLCIYLSAIIYFFPSNLLAQPEGEQDTSPLEWLSTKFNPQSLYTLVFLDESKPKLKVNIKERLAGFKLLIEDPETNTTSEVNCGELKEIIERKPLVTTTRVSLGALFAASAITVFTGGFAAPVAAAVLGGGAAFFSRGKSPNEFCHN